MVSRSEVRVSWRGTQAKAQVHRALAGAVHDGAKVVLDASLRVVPRDTERLARSATTDVDARQLVASVSYDTPYAVRRHERIQDHHRAGKTSKYLERPLIAVRAKVGAAIAARLRRELG